MRRIKVLVVDDHEIVRLGLTHLLQQYPDFETIDGAGTLDEALIRAERGHPDVIIMDVRLKGDSGIEACREIDKRFPGTKVIMLTSYGEDEMVMESIHAGAKGYILKDVGNDEIVRAVRAVFRGEALLDPVVTNKLLDYMRKKQQKSDDIMEQLTEREKKVLAYIAEGRTNREIAKEISLSEKTVRNYVSSILSKLNLANRAEAAAFAAKQKLKHRA